MYSVDPDIESNGSVHNLLCFESYSLGREREKERDIVLIRWLSLTSCSGLCVLFYFKHCFFYFCSLIRSQCIWFLILFSVVVIVITVGSKKYNTLSADMNIESVRAQHVFMPFLRVFSINYLLNIIVRFLFRYLNYIIHFYDP